MLRRALTVLTFICATTAITGCYRSSQLDESRVDSRVEDEAGLDAPRDSEPLAIPDTNVSFDAYVERDADTLLDAFAVPDASVSFDSSVERDADTALDAFPVPDAPPTDASYAATCPVVDASLIDATVSPMTIDSLGGTYLYATYDPTHTFMGLSGANLYILGDGTRWSGGAGGARITPWELRDVEVVGTTIRFHMTVDGVLWQQTDYNSGHHSANYRFDAVDELVIEAERGSRTAVLDVYVRVTGDQPANYRDERFNYLTAPLCAEVHLRTFYTMRAPTVVDEHLFDAMFLYDVATTVDLTSVR